MTGQSGYVDWHRLHRTKPWQSTSRGSTCVWAFWLADYGRSEHDHGVGVLKAPNRHPDWFINSTLADEMLFSVLHAHVLLSPNAEGVFEPNFAVSRSLLGAALLGTADTTYASRDDGRFWWCSSRDLTRRGRRLLDAMSTLYLRDPVIVTSLGGDDR